MLLFGVKGALRTLSPGRRMVNIIQSRKREHSRKPDEVYDLIEECSPGPYLELFARQQRNGWTAWGDEVRYLDPALSETPLILEKRFDPASKETKISRRMRFPKPLFT